MIPPSEPIQPKSSTSSSSPSSATPPSYQPTPPAGGGGADPWKAMFPAASQDDLKKIQQSFYEFAGNQIKKDNERVLKQIKEQRKYF